MERYIPRFRAIVFVIQLLNHRNAQYRNTSLRLLQILPSAHPIAGFELAPIAFAGDDVERFAAAVLSDLFGERGGGFTDFQHITGHCICRTLVGGGCGRNRLCVTVRQTNPALCADSAPVLCADTFDFVDGVCGIVLCAVFLGNGIGYACACADVQVLTRVICTDCGFGFLFGVCTLYILHTAIVGRIDAGRGGLPCTNLIVQMRTEAVACVAHYADFRTNGNSLSLADCN